MSVKCPKCQTDNPSDSKFCKECATPLPFPGDISVTETLETPAQGLVAGSTFVGRYLIIKELGRGGMGAVYKAIDTQIDEEVAIKLIRPEIAADEKTLERFSNELKLARKISHKHVCRMYHLEREGEKPYISMEYLEGQDLKGLIRKKEKLTPKEAIDVSKMVCEGLAEAHRLGVVHRDLKPQNIMIDKEGNAKIMDFGIARSVEAPGVTATGVIIGTPDYMSPEQAEGEEADRRSDIYSLGIILYEMVTGSVPFKGDTAFSVALKHKTQLPQDPRKLNPEVSDDLSRLILICMEKERERRYQTAEALLADLRNIEEGLPLGTKIRPKRATFIQTLIRKKLLIPALVVILAVIAVAIWQLLPQTDIPMAPKIENSIAIISFVNLTGDENNDNYQKSIPNLLITNLENTGYFNVVTWERLHDLLKQLGKEDVEFIGSNLGFELCRMAGVEALINGSLSQAGDVFVTDIKVFDVDTKRLLKSESARGEGVESIFRTQVDELSKKIAQGIGMADTQLDAAQFKVADVTTSSPEAYRYYQQGQDYYYRYNFDAAEESFRNAVALDSTFALAYFRLAWTQLQFGMGDMAAASETSAKAYHFKDRIPEKERYYLEGLYKTLSANINESLVLYHRLVKKYPEEKEAWFMLAGATGGPMCNPLKAISFHEKWLQLDPLFKVGYPWIIRDYLSLGLFEEGKKYALKYLEIAPNDAVAHHHMGYVYFFQGKSELALDEFQRALELDPNYDDAVIGISQTLALQGKFPESSDKLARLVSEQFAPIHRIGAYYQLGFNALALGKFERSLDYLKKMIQVMESYHVDFMLPFGHNYLGLLYYFVSNLSEARREFEYVVANPGTIRGYYGYGISNYLLGIVAVEEARYADAKNMAVKIQQIAEGEDNSIFRELYEDLTAQIKFGQDQRYEATRKVKGFYLVGWWVWMNEISVPREWFLAQIFERRDQIETAIQFYEELVEQKYPWRFNLLYPKSLYRLAKLYEQKGWKDKAIEHYEKFLELWKDADPGIAEVEDAKKRLTRMGIEGESNNKSI